MDSLSVSNFAYICAGVILMLAGGTLFWLFLGIMGFIVGFQWGAHYFAGQPTEIVIIAALLLGAAGVILAFFAQWLAAAIAGFLGGGFLTLNLLGLGQDITDRSILPFLVGGVCGAVLLLLFFDVIVIILTSLIGSLLIVQQLPLSSSAQYITFSGLSVIGMIVQYLTFYDPDNRSLRPSRRRRKY